MANSLYPAFVKVNYLSGVAPHVATFPTSEYFLPDLVNVSGHYTPWTGLTTRDADDMIKDLVNKLKARYPVNANFVDYTIYTMDNPTADPVPRYTAALGIAGTDATVNWQKAVQVTMSFRTTAFGASKLVLLDASSDNDFDKITDLTGLTAYQDIVDQWTDVNNAWSGRDGTRPATFTQIAKDLNDKLRRSYRMN